MAWSGGIERAVRGATLRWIHARVAGRDAVPDGGPVQRVLLLRHDRVGDMIMTTGLLRELSRLRPEIALDVLASPANASIARRAGLRGEVIEYRGGALGFLAVQRRLRRTRYDAVVDAFVLRPRVNVGRALLMLLCGAPARVGIGGREHDFVYTHPIAVPRGVVHHVDTLAHLATYFGIAPDALDLRPHLDVSPSEQSAADVMWGGALAHQAGVRVLVNLSAGGDARRRWPDDRFAALLSALRSRHPRAAVLAISLPGERTALERLAHPLGVATACPSLWESFALVKRASLFVTPDTGLAHAASAFGTRTITLCQPGKDAWVPWQTPGCAVVSMAGPTLATLPVAQVVAAVCRELELAGAR